MSLLIEGDLEHVTIYGLHVPFNTDFRLWIRYTKAIKEKNKDEINKLLVEICPMVLDYPDEIIEALNEYYLVEDGKKVDKEVSKLSSLQNDYVFDLIEDEMLIISDFIREYNIDLLSSSTNLTWRTFKILLNNLSSKSAVAARIDLRQMDIKDVAKKNRAKVEKLKKKYSLHSDSVDANRVTLKDRNKMLIEYAAKRSKQAHERERKD